MIAELSTDIDAVSAEVSVAAEGLDLGAARSDPCLIGHEPLGFDEFLLPFVRVGRARLAARTGNRPPDAGLERWLLRRLARLWREPMYKTFNDARSVRQTTVQGLFEGFGADLTTSGYDALASKALRTSLQFYFERYPVAVRLSDLVIGQWVRACEEFLSRHVHDAADLGLRLAGGKALGDVATIDAGLAESHDGGRAPITVTFSSGAKVVYKPKDLGLENRVSELLELLNSLGAKPELQPLQVFERDGYGWVRFVEHVSCETPEQLKRYYRRAGMLVALTYALDSTDMHMENLIASGEHPMLIDTELIMFADLNGRHEERTVLTTGMLPSPHFVRRGLDISALGGVGSPAPTESPFEHPNSDRMRPRQAEPELHRRTSVPALGGEATEAHGFVDDIVGGFSEMYELIVANRDAVEEWLGCVDGAKVRLLFRSTDKYAQVIKGAFSPAGLTDEATFERALGRLREAIPLEGWEALVEEEISSLRDLSIPLFTVPAGGREVMAGERTTGKALQKSPADLVRTRLAALSEQDKERQIGLIRGCWAG